MTDLRRSSAPQSACGVFVFFLSMTLSAVLMGCGGDLGEAVGPRDQPDRPGDLAKATLLVEVRAEEQDSSIASALGWVGGAVPGAEVVVAGPQSERGTTAATGFVEFRDLLPGSYRVSALRALRDSERAGLPPEGSDVLAFGGAAVKTVSAPRTEVLLMAAAGRRGSLLISEWAPNNIDSAGVSYRFGGYVELYNNSDTTIYLDGKIMAAALRGAWDYPTFPCSVVEFLRNDSLGIWSLGYLYAFPGSGRDYPVLPGQTVVIATDAVDHRPFGGAHDLSGADFEFIGPSDVDNPSVPNMVSLELRTFPGGHGLILITLDDVTVLAEGFDVETAMRGRDPLTGTEFVRIPGEKILDVFAFRYGALSPLGTAPCPQMVHRRFDRQEGLFVFGALAEVSAQRGVFEVLADGRRLLQHTRTTARDFELRPPTPGTVR